MEDTRDVYCFYQVFGSGENFHLEGYGDCSICEPNEKNKECKGYIQIAVGFFEVKDD